MSGRGPENTEAPHEERAMRNFRRHPSTARWQMDVPRSCLGSSVSWWKCRGGEQDGAGQCRYEEGWRLKVVITGGRESTWSDGNLHKPAQAIALGVSAILWPWLLHCPNDLRTEGKGSFKDENSQTRNFGISGRQPNSRAIQPDLSTQISEEGILSPIPAPLFTLQLAHFRFVTSSALLF